MSRNTLVLLTLVSLMLSAADWPQWRGPNRDGVSSERVEPWKDELKVLWRQAVGEGHSSPVVAGGKVFLHAKVAQEERETVLAFDANSGKLVWEVRYQRTPYQNQYGNGPRSTPVVDDGKVFTLGVTGILNAWDANTGEAVWTRDILKEFKAANLYFGVSSSPVIVGDKLLVMPGGPDASIVALDKRTGKTVWQAGGDKASYASPFVTELEGRKLGLFLTQQNLVGLNPDDGQVFWQFPMKDLLSESSTTPARAGDVLFASSVTFGSVGLKLVTKDAKPAFEQLWKDPALTCYFSTPVSLGERNEHFYVVTGKLPPLASADLHCLEAATGKVLWTRKKVGTYHATLLLAKDRLLLLEEAGDLVLIDPNPKEYRELARAKVCGQTWAHPALSNGKLFVRDDKELICVELSR